jgi:polyisoprenoid-binding protein YceI
MKYQMLILAAVLALTGESAFADSYKIDPDHVWVTFTIGHAGWSNAHGIFHKVNGTLTLDKAAPAKSAVALEIDSNSIDTNSSQRDSDIKTPDFLNLAEFPSITFKSTKIEPTDDKHAKVTGDISIAGVSKPVTLNATFNKEAPLPWDAKTIKIGFSATGVIALADFAQKKALSFGLGPELNLAIDLEAVKN